MSLNLPQLPPQSIPALDDRGGDATLPPLFSRTWWLFLNSVAGMLGALSSSVAALADTVFGRADLTHAGAIPKVSAAGTLKESSITDDGTMVTSKARAEIDTGATPADSQLVVKANGLGAIGLVVIGPDNVELTFDCEWTANNWVARDTSCALIKKSGAQLTIFGATGAVVGGVPALAVKVSIDLATGDINALTGVFRVAGVQVVGARLAAVSAPSGGTVIDVQARTAINDIRARLAAGTGHGLTA